MLLHLEGLLGRQRSVSNANQGPALPEHLARSTIWDQGKEMSRQVQFTLDTGVQINFCDRRQRGSNENTNGLLRQ